MPLIRFEDIVGQPAALNYLRRALQVDRLPHGLLFSGRVGVGKARTAEALATVFLCHSPPAPDQACGACQSCAAMASASHPDHHIIVRQLIRQLDRGGESKASDIAKKVIDSEVIEKAALKPVLSRGKVFVIEEAELMNTSAQNTLLKTLEEPAGRTLIVLLTDQPGALLPTIRSRCQQVLFGTLSEEWVMSELRRQGVNAEQAADAVRFAEGSMGLASRWLEDGVIDAAVALERMLMEMRQGRGEDLAKWLMQAGEQYAKKQLERDPDDSKETAARRGIVLYLGLAALIVREWMRQTSRSAGMENCCQMLDLIAATEQHVSANGTLLLACHHLAAGLRPLARQSA